MNINELPFEPKHSEKALKGALDFFEQRREDFKATANFGVVKDDGLTMPFVGVGCHASMMQSGVPNKLRALVATEIAIPRTMKRAADLPNLFDPTGESYYPFLKWFTQDSPFARFIVNGNDFDFIKENGIIVSSDIPSAVFQNILITSRHFYECSAWAFRLFGELIEKYPNAGMLIYNLVFCTTLSVHYGVPAFTGAPPPPEDPLVCSYPTHRAWGLFPTMEELNNFCAGEFGDPLAAVAHEDHHYRNKATIYGGVGLARKVHKGVLVPSKYHTFIHDLLANDEDFKEGLRKHRGNENTPIAIKNPFARPRWDAPAAQSPATCKLSEIKDFVLPFIFEKGLIPSVK